MGFALRCFQRLSRPHIATRRVPLAGQPVHQRCVHSGPLVLGAASLKPPAPTVDRDRQFCYSPRMFRGEGQVISACLSWSPRSSDCIFTSPPARVRRTVSEGCRHFCLAFPADCLHPSHFHRRKPVAWDPPGFPAYSRIYRQQRSLTVSRRSEPSSRTALMGEQPNPWELLHPQDAMSRHRGAKPPRRCGLLGEISLLSPG